MDINIETLMKEICLPEEVKERIITEDKLKEKIKQIKKKYTISYCYPWTSFRPFRQKIN